MNDRHDFVGELELNFFPTNEFEQETPEDLEQNGLALARNGLRILMMGWQDLKPLMNTRAFKAVFVQRDHVTLKTMRLAFQQGFDHLYETQLKERQFTEIQIEQTNLYFSNCLSLLPFGDITPYESIRIPQYINNQWNMVEYKVVPIELTPTTGFKQLFIRDEDRVFAYGLEPLNKSTAIPHLIFMGTTYPAGQGFLSQINTDLEAFETVGKKLYRSGEKRIREWLLRQDKKPHVCGMSLGGALSLLLAMHHGDKLHRVDALNPAGIYDPWKKSRFDRWDELLEKPDVIIQRQGQDVVSRFGIYKKDWSLVDVTAPDEKQGPNFLIHHALNFAGLKGVQFKFVQDIEKDNQDRKVQNFILYSLARAVFYFAVSIPYRYIFRPVLYYILDHKIQIALIGISMSSIFVFPILAMSIAGLSATLNTLLSAVIIGSLLSLLTSYIQDKIYDQRESLLSYAIDWFKQQSRLTQSSMVLGSLFMIIAPFLTSLSILTSVYLIAATPTFINLLNQITNIALTIFGQRSAGLPIFLAPKLQRNATMDLYQNTATTSFTAKELGEYYHAKRCILKNKSLLQESYTQCHVKFGTSTDAHLSHDNEQVSTLSKTQVIEKSMDPTRCDEIILVETTKAKLYDIKNTIRLIHCYGLHNSTILKEALVQEERDYKLGK